MKSLVKGLPVIALAAMALTLPAYAHRDHDKGVTVGVSQSNGGQLVIDDGENNAAINAFAFASSSGNIGANVASGNANQQNNTTYIDYSSSLKDLSVGTEQGNGGNFVVGSGGEESTSHHGKNKGKETTEAQAASISGSAFSNASGNVGANVASGNLNQQSNVAVLLANDTLKKLTIGTEQHTGGSVYLGDGLNESTIGDNSFQGASGNVGANVAAGNANQQSNTLVVNTVP